MSRSLATILFFDFSATPLNAKNATKNNMIFIPIALLIFILFILFLPILFLMGYFHVIVIGFENLGISADATIFILLCILAGSLINIPLTRKKLVLVQEPRFFGLFKVPRVKEHYLAINLGGAIIPALMAFYFLILIKSQGFDLAPILIAIFLMSLVGKIFSRIVPGRGIVLPAFIPPLFSAFFAFVLSPEIAAPVAFISGVLGTLIGADLLNLRRIRSYTGLLSIGGAGIFDGVFLVGVVSALLSGL